MCWRLADVVPVPKKSLSSAVGDYRHISFTVFRSKVFKKIGAGKLSKVLESTSLFPPSQFS